MSFCGLNAGMKTSAPLFNAILNNAPFHSNSHITVRRRLKSLAHCTFIW